MPFTLQKLPDEPIIIMTSDARANAAGEVAEIGRRLAEATAGMEAPIFRITDLTAAQGMNFSNLMAALAGDFRSGQPGSAGDPRVRIVLVSSDPLIKFGAESAKQEQYGGLEPPPVFATLDEALAYCRSQLLG